MIEDTQDHLTLKWGTLKAWNLTSAKGQELLRRYHELGSSASVMMQHDTPEQKELLCQMIDECGAAEIFLDWDGKYVSKDAAKKYVMEYGAVRVEGYAPDDYGGRVHASSGRGVTPDNALQDACEKLVVKPWLRAVMSSDSHPLNELFPPIPDLGKRVMELERELAAEKLGHADAHRQIDALHKTCERYENQLYGSSPSAELPQDWQDIFVEYRRDGRTDAWLYQQIAAHNRRAEESKADPMAGRLEILAQRLKDCDYGDRGTIQCGTAGNANLVRYNGDDIVACAHVYDERDRLLLGWLGENAQRILDALCAPRSHVAGSEPTYVPGLWRCAKCKLDLLHTNLHVYSGTTSPNTDPQACPNGCGPMWRVSEADYRKELLAQVNKLFDEVQALKSASMPSEFLTEVADALFGCFASPAERDTFRCACCDWPIDIHDWINAEHDAGCLISRVRAYLAEHKPEALGHHNSGSAESTRKGT